MGTTEIDTGTELGRTGEIKWTAYAWRCGPYSLLATKDTDGNGLYIVFRDVDGIARVVDRVPMTEGAREAIGRIVRRYERKLRQVQQVQNDGPRHDIPRPARADHR